MSVKAQHHVWEHSKQRGPRLLVLLAIADSANDDGFCWLGMPKLSKKARQDDKHTRQYVQQIETDGELIVYERKTDDGHHHLSNLYKVVMPGTSTTPPDDLKGKLRQRAAVQEGVGAKKGVPPESPGDGGDLGSTPPGELGRGVGANSPPDPFIDPSIDPEKIAPTGAPLTLLPIADDANSLAAPAIEDHATDADALPVSESAPVDPYADWIPLDQFPDEAPTAAYACTRDDVNALIAAWWDWVPVRPTQRGKEIASRAHFGSKANREFAQTLTERGASPADVIGLLADIRLNDRSPWAYLREREMTFCYVGEILCDWIPADRAENFYTPDCPRITPRKPGHTIRLGEISQGIDLYSLFADDPNVILDVPKPWLAAPSSDVTDLDADPETWASSYQADDVTYLAELAAEGFDL